MSGPKSSRYRLTPEQRKALAEARERERKRQAILALLQKRHDEAGKLRKNVKDALAFAASLSEHSETGAPLTQKLLAIESLCEALLSLTVAEDNASLEKLTALAERVDESVSALTKQKEEADILLEEGKSLLEKELTEKLDKGLALSFEETEDPLPKKRILMAKRLSHLAQKDTLPAKLIAELKNASASLEETEDNALRIFEALTLQPLEKKCEAAEKESLACHSEYLTCRADYEGLCRLRETDPIPTECTREGIEILKKATEQLAGDIAYDDEEGYIAECLDKVMGEMGYYVVGERTHQKKSGKRFHHELYTYKDGTVVNVTTADDGKITMELGSPDRVDRLPNEKETAFLCHAMEEFCGDFAEIEERLAAMGVVVGDRLRHLPATAEHAQIINLNEYEMQKPLFPVEQEEKEANQENAIRRRQRKRKLLRRAL